MISYTLFLRYRIYQHAADNHERSNIFKAIRHIKHQYSIRRLVSSFKNLYIYQFMCHLMPGLTSIEEAAKNTDGSQTKLRLLHESMDTGGWGGGNFTVRKSHQLNKNFCGFMFGPVFVTQFLCTF